MGLSCLWEQLFAACSATKIKLKSFEQKAIVQSAYMYIGIIEQAMNKRSCDTSTHDTTGFTVH